MTREQSKRQVLAEYPVAWTVLQMTENRYISFNCIRFYIGIPLEEELYGLFRQAMKESKRKASGVHVTCISARDHAYNSVWNTSRGFTLFT